MAETRPVVLTVAAWTSRRAGGYLSSNLDLYSLEVLTGVLHAPPPQMLRRLAGSEPTSCRSSTLFLSTKTKGADTTGSGLLGLF